MKNTKLQRTLLKVAERLRNLAAYEGAEYFEVRMSGKRCPACESWGVEAGRRYYCHKCKISWNRDWGLTVY